MSNDPAQGSSFSAAAQTDRSFAPIRAGGKPGKIKGLHHSILRKMFDETIVRVHDDTFPYVNGWPAFTKENLVLDPQNVAGWLLGYDGSGHNHPWGWLQLYVFERTAVWIEYTPAELGILGKLVMTEGNQPCSAKAAFHYFSSLKWLNRSDFR